MWNNSNALYCQSRKGGANRQPIYSAFGGLTGKQGFSLLEVIVALAVLALCVSVLLRIFSGVSGAARIGEDYYEAIQIAESQMAELISGDNAVGTRSGKVGEQFRWASRVSDYRPNNDNPLITLEDINDPLSIFAPYQYEITVSWGNYRKRSYTLSTIHLGPAQ